MVILGPSVAAGPALASVGLPESWKAKPTGWHGILKAARSHLYHSPQLHKYFSQLG